MDSSADQVGDRSLEADLQLIERGISLLRRQLDTVKRDQLVLLSLRDRAARDTQGFVDDLVAGRLAIPQPQQVIHIPSLEWILAQPRSSGDSELGHAPIPYHQPTSIDPLPPVTATRVLPPLSLAEPISSGPSWSVGSPALQPEPISRHLDASNGFSRSSTPGLETTSNASSRSSAPAPPSMSTNPLANPLAIFINADAYSSAAVSNSQSFHKVARDREQMRRLLVRDNGPEDSVIEDATKVQARLSGAQYASVPLDSMEDLISGRKDGESAGDAGSAGSSRPSTSSAPSSSSAPLQSSAPIRPSSASRPPNPQQTTKGLPLRYPNKRRKTTAADFNYDVFAKARAAPVPPPPEPLTRPITTESAQRPRPATAPPPLASASSSDSRPKKAVHPSSSKLALVDLTSGAKRSQSQPQRAAPARSSLSTDDESFGGVSDALSSPEKPKPKPKSAAKPKRASAPNTESGVGNRTKRGPGRTSKNGSSTNGTPSSSSIATEPSSQLPPPKRGPGRPRKNPLAGPSHKRSHSLDADDLLDGGYQDADGEDDSVLEIDDGLDPALAAYFSGNTTHAESQCARCRACPIIGERYACRDCIAPWNTDLCAKCYAKRSDFENEYHTSHHRFRKVTIVPDL